MDVDIVDLGAKYVSFEEGFDFVIEDATEDLEDREVLVSNLEIRAWTIAYKNTNTFFESWCTRKVSGAGCHSRKSVDEVADPTL